MAGFKDIVGNEQIIEHLQNACLLYTSDAADEL